MEKVLRTKKMNKNYIKKMNKPYTYKKKSYSFPELLEIAREINPCIAERTLWSRLQRWKDATRAVEIRSKSRSSDNRANMDMRVATDGESVSGLSKERRQLLHELNEEFDSKGGI